MSNSDVDLASKLFMMTYRLRLLAGLPGGEKTLQTINSQIDHALDLAQRRAYKDLVLSSLD
jgi:hypothetical protein